MKLHLVPDWRQCWRWFSMQAQGVATAILGAWLAVPEDLRDRVPLWLVITLVLILLLLGMVGRLVDQPAARSGDPK